MASPIWHFHAWRNLLQTLLLIFTLFGIAVLVGYVLFGEVGFWIALAVSGVALAAEPAMAARMTLHLYQARPIAYEEAPELWSQIHRLSERAGLPSIPALYYVPSAIINAFAVGNRRQAAIALSDGLLSNLSLREIACVMAHEVAHVAHGDLRVMNLADYISRLTALFALVGQLSLLLALPWLLEGTAAINWVGLLILALSPHLALAAQLGLSRVREFDADLEGARISGDPVGLARALAKIEQVNRSWRNWLLPGWGNPDPSWLRTHPATEERIRRLQHVQSASTGADERVAAQRRHSADMRAQNVRSAPRWRLGGYWW